MKLTKSQQESVQTSIIATEVLLEKLESDYELDKAKLEKRLEQAKEALNCDHDFLIDKKDHILCSKCNTTWYAEKDIKDFRDKLFN